MAVKGDIAKSIKKSKSYITDTLTLCAQDRVKPAPIIPLSSANSGAADSQGVCRRF